MAKTAYAADLKSAVFGRAGSNPALCTMKTTFLDDLADAISEIDDNEYRIERTAVMIAALSDWAYRHAMKVMEDRGHSYDNYSAAFDKAYPVKSDDPVLSEDHGTLGLERLVMAAVMRSHATPGSKSESTDWREIAMSGRQNRKSASKKAETILEIVDSISEQHEKWQDDPSFPSSDVFPVLADTVLEEDITSEVWGKWNFLDLLERTKSEIQDIAAAYNEASAAERRKTYQPGLSVIAKLIYEAQCMAIAGESYSFMSEWVGLTSNPLAREKAAIYDDLAASLDFAVEYLQANSGDFRCVFWRPQYQEWEREGVREYDSE